MNEQAFRHVEHHAVSHRRARSFALVVGGLGIGFNHPAEPVRSGSSAVTEGSDREDIGLRENVDVVPGEGILGVPHRFVGLAGLSGECCGDRVKFGVFGSCWSA
jgi:hypothetical protein